MSFHLDPYNVTLPLGYILWNDPHIFNQVTDVIICVWLTVDDGRNLKALGKYCYHGMQRVNRTEERWDAGSEQGRSEIRRTHP